MSKSLNQMPLGDSKAEDFGLHQPHGGIPFTRVVRKMYGGERVTTFRSYIPPKVRKRANRQPMVEVVHASV